MPRVGVFRISRIYICIYPSIYVHVYIFNTNRRGAWVTEKEDTSVASSFARFHVEIILRFVYLKFPMRE